MAAPRPALPAIAPMMAPPAAPPSVPVAARCCPCVISEQPPRNPTATRAITIRFMSKTLPHHFLQGNVASRYSLNPSLGLLSNVFGLSAAQDAKPDIACSRVILASDRQ